MIPYHIIPYITDTVIPTTIVHWTAHERHQHISIKRLAAIGSICFTNSFSETGLKSISIFIHHHLMEGTLNVMIP
jgi:hypothetical protein